MAAPGCLTTAASEKFLIEEIVYNTTPEVGYVPLTGGKVQKAGFRCFTIMHAIGHGGAAHGEDLKTCGDLASTNGKRGKLCDMLEFTWKIERSRSDIFENIGDGSTGGIILSVAGFSKSQDDTPEMGGETLRDAGIGGQSAGNKASFMRGRGGGLEDDKGRNHS